MLGTSRNIAIHNETDGSGFAKVLFSGIQGVFAYCRKENDFMKHSFFRASGMEKAPYAGERDVYVSMNAFYSCKNPSRSTEKLKRLCNLYVDLDIYKSDYRDCTKEEILQILRDEYIGRIIPEPTIVTDSGNGLALIWHLRNEDKKALPRYLAAEKYLINALSEFGADKACCDASRILRVPGTINGKCGRTVRIMQYTDTAYTLYEIMREYDIKPLKSVYTGKKETVKHPYGTATEKMRVLAAKIAADCGTEAPNFDNFQETFDFIKDHQNTKKPGKENAGRNKKIIPFAEIRAKNFLLKEYINDIETLILSRKGEDCKREYSLFLYRLFIAEATRDSDLALSRTLALNAKLSCPFPVSYVEKRTQSAQKKIDSGDTYHYKKETIIEALEITEDEMRELPLCALTNLATEKERKARRNRRNYERRLAEQGKEKKSVTVQKRREQVAAMREQGKTPEEIMQALSISRATYYKDVAAIAAGTCVEACTRIIEQAADMVTATAEKGTKAIKTAISGNSQKLSPSIIANAVGVPHSPAILSDSAFGEGEGTGGRAKPPPLLA